MKKVLFLAAVVSLAGCATPEGNTGPVVEKQYRTGSNLAVRHVQPGDPLTTVSKEDLDRQRDSSLSTGSTMPAPRPGGR